LHLQIRAKGLKARRPDSLDAGKATDVVLLALAVIEC
jgi:hypothetical protein